MRKFKQFLKLSAVMLIAAACTTGVKADAAQLSGAVKQEMVEQYGAKPATPVISLKETVISGESKTYTLKFNPVPQGCYLYFNVYQTNPEESLTGSWYTDEKGGKYFEGHKYAYEGDTEETFYSSNYAPGTYKVVAYLMNNDAVHTDYYANGYTYWYSNYESAASNAVTFATTLDTYVSTVVTSTSVQLNMDSNGRATGYEVYRGKLLLAKTTKAAFKDTGLLSNTKYSYKVRAYYVNPDTKKIVYGAYKTVEATTSGSALKLKIAMSGKKAKLSWSKVAGATKYEVYQLVTDSDASETFKGSSNGFSAYKLVKKLSKSKTSFTTGNLTANKDYYYFVRAVSSGKNPIVVEQSAYISTSFGEPSIVRSYINANGSKTVEWKKVYGATGYAVQKYDTVKEDWVTVKTLGSSTTTFTAPAPNGTDSTSDSYRVCAFQKSIATRSEYDDFYVYASLGSVASVKAVRTTNGVKVSWSAVKGADYYEVYRCPAGALYKNKNTGCYSTETGGRRVTAYNGVVTPQVESTDKDGKKIYYQNYTYSEEKIVTTSIIDYDSNAVYTNYSSKPVNTGLELGGSYQYYVVAYKAKYKEADTRWVYDVVKHEGSYQPYTYMSYDVAETLGCKSIGEVTYTNVKAPGKATIKTASSKKKGKVTLKLKKAVAGAKEYEIYRSTKKNKGFVLVGRTSKTSYTDSKLKSGKKYYYKIKAITPNEKGGDVKGGFSSVKAVTSK